MLTLGSLDKITGTDPQRLSPGEQGWEVRLDAWSGAILAWYL
jgi:hypothetical protein